MGQKHSIKQRVIMSLISIGICSIVGVAFIFIFASEYDYLRTPTIITCIVASILLVIGIITDFIDAY